MSLINDPDHVFMYFKPIMDSPMKTIVNYYRFQRVILDSFKEKSEESKEETIFRKQILLGNEPIVCKQMLFGKDLCGKSELAQFSDSKYEKNNKVFRIRLWDTGIVRKDAFISILKRGCKTIIYCFDLSDESSFTEMKKLMNEHEKTMPTTEYLKSEEKNLVIIGLKRDLPRSVPMSQVDDLLSELVPNNGSIELADLKVQYFEISSKTDSRQNIMLPFLFGLLMSEEAILREPKPTDMVH